MITARIKRGLKATIPHSPAPKKATFGNTSWLHKYNAESKAFCLDFADTEDLADGILTVDDITICIKVI